ncbi:ATP-binding protein [Streptomyces sp. NPDC005962]|uniref:ATP-binding protein n=1 Tax=Streptomyces sp. NPDC005962 TaxID=3154466 RepID=UPI0033FEB3A2
MSRSLPGLPQRPAPADDEDLGRDRPALAVSVNRHRIRITGPEPCGEGTMSALVTRRLFRAEFPALPDRAAAVRRMVTGHLNEWRLGALVDGAVLATNELFANAVEHGSAGPADTVTITVSLEVAAGPFGHELRVEVADGSPVIPIFRSASPIEESGRGLAIVDCLASDWGTEPPDPGGEGKKVWFTLPLERAS